MSEGVAGAFACRYVSWLPLLAVGVALSLAGCREKPLPVYGAVPDFTLTSQTGQPFQGASLDGSVWIADFFFTHCTGPCPRMSARFRRIEKSFPGRNDLKLVSFTVDPQRDDASVLADYARKFGAEPGRWFFLTGPMPDLNRMSRNVFMLGDVDGQLDHSTRFVLVDRKRQIRGFYRSDDSGSMEQITRDIRSLLKENT